MSYRSLWYNGHFGIINSEIEITAHEMSEAHIGKDVVCNSLANVWEGSPDSGIHYRRLETEIFVTPFKFVKRFLVLIVGPCDLT